MKSLIVYYSEYNNNTEKIAEVLAKKIKADLVNLKDCNDINIDDYSLIGFGSGVYRESMAPQLFKAIEKLNLKGKDAFVFSTSGAGLGFYNKKAINLIVSKGATCKGDFACKGSFNSKDFSENKIFEVMGKLAQGHPNDKDIKKAEKFIEKVVL